MDNTILTELAEKLDNAAMNAQAIEQLSKTHQIDLDEAYEIQRISIARRLTRGEKLVGLKMGFTSKAKMEQMGVHDLIWGRLTDAMMLENDGAMDLSKYIHPRAEPELAFKFSKDVNELIELKDIPDVISSVAAAVEIIDSRYKDFKFSLEDVIADNCSSTGFVIGEWKDLNFETDDLSLDFSISGEVKHLGSTEAILGNPLQSIVDAIRLSIKYNEPIKKGMILLAGAATPAVFLNQGDQVKVNIECLGDVILSCP